MSDGRVQEAIDDERNLNRTLQIELARKIVAKENARRKELADLMRKLDYEDWLWTYEKKHPIQPKPKITKIMAEVK